MLGKCPVCSGKGLVSYGFYSFGAVVSISTQVTPLSEQCKSCDGRGYIYIKEMMSYPYYGVPKTTGGEL